MGEDACPQDGHEHVACEAEVAEQTVYNYFPTKEKLVTDREQPSARPCTGWRQS